ncbi:MAG: mechanosensitive ion channel, partial [Bacteroidetes bacterium]|nr:mechanosensitive ion channel [Bacteroidota bacterium]
EEAQKHPGFLDHRTEEDKASGEPPVAVRLISFGDSSVNLRGYVWAANPMAAFIMKCDLHKSIKERFDNEGIEIPFPYRTVVFKNKKDE